MGELRAIRLESNAAGIGLTWLDGRSVAADDAPAQVRAIQILSCYADRTARPVEGFGSVQGDRAGFVFTVMLPGNVDEFGRPLSAALLVIGRPTSQELQTIAGTVVAALAGIGVKAEEPDIAKGLRAAGSAMRPFAATRRLIHVAGRRIGTLLRRLRHLAVHYWHRIVRRSRHDDTP